MKRLLLSSPNRTGVEPPYRGCGVPPLVTSTAQPHSSDQRGGFAAHGTPAARCRCHDAAHAAVAGSRSLCCLTLLLALGTAALAVDAKRSSNTVILTEVGAQNLRIETLEAEETDFEEVAFSLGRIEPLPGKVGVVSSRIAGRVVELKVAPGDQVQAGQEIARIESRQPGDPPPVITLRAPLAGMVTKMDVRLGDPVDPEKGLLEITDLTEVAAVAHVPEHLAGRMKPGLKAHIKVAALPEEKPEGELLRFGTAADGESGTLEAIFRLPNPESRLRPNMRAEFSIVLSQRAGVVSVPRSALQGEAASRFVYVEDFELPHAFVKTEVVVGQVNDRFAEIVSGLLPGDKVVTHGAYSLAFAGGGGVSLKEALDAAHGHEHAEDGSELTPAKRAEMEAKKRAAAGLSDPHAGSGGGPFWKIVSGVLLVLLIVSAVWRPRLQPEGAR